MSLPSLVSLRPLRLLPSFLPLPLSLFLSLPLAVRRTDTQGQLEEVDGPLCPAPGSILFFRASSTSQSDTPPHSARFSPPLCQCTTDVDVDDEQRAQVAREPSTMMTHGTCSGPLSILCPHEYAAERFFIAS